jgi:hypothetical protein
MAPALPQFIPAGIGVALVAVGTSVLIVPLFATVDSIPLKINAAVRSKVPPALVVNVPFTAIFALAELVPLPLLKDRLLYAKAPVTVCPPVGAEYRTVEVFASVMVGVLVDLIAVLVVPEKPLGSAVSNVPLMVAVSPVFAKETIYVDALRIEPDATVNALVIEIASPRVVVPALIIKLLKLVKRDAGRVLVAVSSTVPVPGVHMLFPVTALTAKP